MFRGTLTDTTTQSQNEPGSRDVWMTPYFPKLQHRNLATGCSLESNPGDLMRKILGYKQPFKCLPRKSISWYFTKASRLSS